MKKYSLALPVVALILSACDPVSERDCGVFDHPDLDVWESSLGESTVQFMNEEGATINFSRNAVVLNEPFLGTDGSSNDEDVICQLSASIRYVSSDNNLVITSVYLQSERTLLESSDEILSIDHIVESPENTLLAGNFLADISIEATRSILSSARVLYLDSEDATETIGGQSYQDVVRVNAPQFLFVEQPTDVEGETTIVVLDARNSQTDGDTAENEQLAQVNDTVRQIVIARQFGLVAFTDDQGAEFVRVTQ